MIYLIRPSADDRYPTEIAVLEHAERLSAYLADGRHAASCTAWQTAWRAKSVALAAGIRMQPAHAGQVDASGTTCRYCHMGPIVRPFGATPWCRACTRPQVDDAKQR